MVIPYNSLPFGFLLINEIGHNDEYFSQVEFTDSIEDINSGVLTNKIRIRENSDTLVKFTSYFNEPFRLEMDGFDGVDVAEVFHDDGIYLEPSEKIIKVFSYISFPLPPGLYIIKVSGNEKNYYTSFEVLGSRLDSNSWELMATDVFESIKMLAFQMAVQKVSAVNKPIINEFMGSLILKMNVIEQHYNKVIAALDDLSKNPHNKISKKYVLSSKAEQFAIDYQCNKLNTRKINIGSGYVPLKFTDYQLTENAYMKRIVLELDKIIRLFINEMGSKKSYIMSKLENDQHGKDKNTYEYRRNVTNLEFLLKYYTKAKKIKSVINNLKDAAWFGSVNENIIQRVPSQSMLDPRYGILSKVSKELKTMTIRYDIDNRLSFIWHNSSKLYELWGIIKLVEAFRNIGFVLEEGLNVEKIGGELKIAGLSSGDFFILKKNDIMVKITYEPSLYKSDRETSLDTDPVYTVGKNVTPDCKIDFFYDINASRLYMTSLIVDFKYRAKQSIWSDYRDDCKKQLISYASDTRSVMVSYKDRRQSLRIRPVSEVWALYPNSANVQEEQIENDLFINLISFVPGYQDVIERHISRFINEYLIYDIAEVNRLYGAKEVSAS